MKFSIQFTSVLWTSNKSIKAEYGLIKASGIHIEKGKQNSSPACMEAEVLFSILFFFSFFFT